MNLIQGITDQPKQTIQLQIADGSAATWTLEYKPNQLGWFWGLTWGSVDIQGCRLVSSPNILRQYREILPFGLSILSIGNVEPLNQEDFSDGTITVYLLDSTDVALVESEVFPGLTP